MPAGVMVNPLTRGCKQSLNGKSAIRLLACASTRIGKLIPSAIA